MSDQIRTINRTKPRPYHKPDAMITRRDMCPHNTGKRIDIGNANRVPAKSGGACHHFRRMRGTGQESKIAVTAQYRR
jgi:hypothetical protein